MPIMYCDSRGGGFAENWCLFFDFQGHFRHHYANHPSKLRQQILINIFVNAKVNSMSSSNNIYMRKN